MAVNDRAFFGIRLFPKRKLVNHHFAYAKGPQPIYLMPFPGLVAIEVFNDRSSSMYCWHFMFVEPQKIKPWP